MKNKVLVIAGMLAGLCFSLEAHPPKKNEITFDREQMTIRVKAFHPVGNPASHFVKKMMLEWNGTEIAKEEFTRQTNEEYQETEFTLPSSISVQTGDEITVTSHCNKFGKKKTVLRID